MAYCMLIFLGVYFDIPDGGYKLDTITGGPQSKENSSASWVTWW